MLKPMLKIFRKIRKTPSVNSTLWTLGVHKSMWRGGFAVTKKVITVAILLVIVATSIVVLPSLTQASWFGQGGGASRVWSYRQKIVIDHTKVSPVGKSTLTNFPVEISL